MQDYNNLRINSLDFHRTDDWLIAAGEDDSLHIYNTQTGTQAKLLHSKKYGVGQIRWTHSPDAVIHTSTRVCPAAFLPWVPAPTRFNLQMDAADVQS